MGSRDRFLNLASVLGSGIHPDDLPWVCVCMAWGTIQSVSLGGFPSWTYKAHTHTHSNRLSVSSSTLFYLRFKSQETEKNMWLWVVNHPEGSHDSPSWWWYDLSFIHVYTWLWLLSCWGSALGFFLLILKILLTCVYLCVSSRLLQLSSGGAQLHHRVKMSWSWRFFIPSCFSVFISLRNESGALVSSTLHPSLPLRRWFCFLPSLLLYLSVCVSHLNPCSICSPIFSLLLPFAALLKQAYTIFYSPSLTLIQADSCKERFRNIEGFGIR